MSLTTWEREIVDRWVMEKFYVVDASVIFKEVDIDMWERIDPWAAEHIESFGEFERFQGGGSLAGHMVVRVTLDDPFADQEEGDEPISSVWSYLDIQRNGYDPLSNAEVAEFASHQWEHLFDHGDDDMVYEMLGTKFWIPRGMADANADGVSAFAGKAGRAGFYVFDVQDKVVLGVDYDASDVGGTQWPALYSALTGRQLGSARQPRGR